MDMPMGDNGSSSSGPSSPMEDMMTPYLHFTRGDYVLFKQWRATSAGAIVGVCFGLFFIAIFERWLSAMRDILERKWRAKALKMARASSSTKSSPEVPEKSLKYEQEPDVYTRAVPPSFLTCDLPRGLLHAIQALFAYVFMLVVMNYNASYLIAIVAGLGVGETLFGRLGNGRYIH